MSAAVLSPPLGAGRTSRVANCRTLEEAAMTGQDHIRTARELVDAFNANDWATCKAVFAPDAVYDEVGTGRRIQGNAAIVACWQAWKEAMPDVKGTISKSLATDDH